MRRDHFLKASIVRASYRSLRWKSAIVCCSLAALFLLAGFRIAQQASEPEYRPWITHNRYEDFAQGTVGDGGSNLYIARSGTVQMLHRWDLNNDGFLDVFVGQDHNQVENAEVLVYWGSQDGPRSILPDVPDQQPLARLLRELAARNGNATRLPSDGGGRSLLADLNADGYPEMVFCNYIHNYSVHMNAFIYWGSSGGYRADRRTELPTLMAQGVAAADFNRDGFVDLAFANSGIEGGERFGFNQHLESFIYWNGPTGFSPDRRTAIPTISAVDCAAGDFTGDGYPELVFLNNNSQHKSVYVYSGGPEGFSEKRREIRQGGDPVGVRLADLNADGHLELAILHRDNRAEIFRGSGSSLEAKPWAELPTLGAAGCQVADLNRDGHPDLVFANSAADRSYVYWGNAAGFSTQQRMELPTLHAAAADVADFNGDGWTDLVFSNESDEKTFDVGSYIYWNSPQGFDAAHRSELQGFGSVSVVAGEMNGDGHPDVALISRNSGSRGSIDSYIYWGNRRHHYSAASLTRLPGSEGGTAIADFDQNGWVDIAFPSGRIYWGAPEGYNTNRRVDLDRVEGGKAASAADLNRDGYLDLVIPRGVGYGKNTSALGTILWGGRDGFRTEKRTDLKIVAHFCQSPTIADLNRDGFLDLIFPDDDTENLELFWGSAEGFRQDRRTLLKIHSTSHVEVADLNGDGWLDLIMGGVYDPKLFGRPMRILTLLWGGPEGFSLERSRQLEGYEAEEQAVADLNKDGYLDIVTTNYHAYTTRSLPFFIYWGGPGGSYSESRRSSLPAESSSALTVADLNQDGWWDIVPFSHVDRGDHGTGAHIYWGSAEGYSVKRRHWIQTFGPHYGVRRDIGNIYDRRLEEEYLSAPLAWPQAAPTGRLRWKAQTPHGTGVKFQLRSAATEAALAKTSWAGPQGDSKAWYVDSGSEFAVPANHRSIQYRVALTTPDGGSTPVLQEVGLDIKRK